MTSHEPSSQVREQPRAETDDIHRLILESVRDYAIFMTDADGLVQTWPPGAASVFGWTAEDMIGRSFELTFVPEDREQGIPQQEMEKALEIGATPNVRWHQRSDGERVFIEGSTQLLKRGEGSRHGFLKIGRDMTERRRMEQRQQVLVAELQHRTRNLMAVVQSIFNNTLRSSNTIADLAATYQDRLAALARVQGLLSRLKDGDRITFDELIRIELSAIGALAIGEAGSRATIEGPPGVRLRSSTVQTLALALHELATNAGKYGALSERGGHLHVRWSLPPGDRSLRVEWTESGVAIPNLEAARERQGHGRQLIERALPYQLQAETSFEIGADGVRCTIVLPVSQSTVQEAAAMTDLPFAGKRVLIVEDEYYIACDLAHAFGEAGAEVVGPVSSLGQAVAVGAAPLDLAILDINLAGEMVYPLADQLLARSVPIAFATGYDASAIPARYANVPRFEKPGALKAIISRVASLGRGAGVVERIGAASERPGEGNPMSANGQTLEAALGIAGHLPWLHRCAAPVFSERHAHSSHSHSLRREVSVLLS